MPLQMLPLIPTGSLVEIGPKDPQFNNWLIASRNMLMGAMEETPLTQ